MAANYVLLERIELNASAASVTFNNIPQSGYTDLKIVMSMRNVTNTETTGAVYFNSDTTNANYSARRLLGDGSAASSANTANPYFFYMDTTGETANTFSNCEMYIPNYTGSTQKSVSVESVTENNATAALAVMVAGLWTGTAAINAIQIRPYSGGGGNFAANSTFSLYGLTAVGTTPVIAPKASGGNITTDGTYWYHTFIYSDVFTPQTTLTCDALIVGAGGGGCVGINGVAYGGGAAGGIVTEIFSKTTTAGAKTVTVGAGGAGSGTSGTSGSAGGTSSVVLDTTYTSTGGGGGQANGTGGSNALYGGGSNSNGAGGGAGAGGAGGNGSSGGNGTGGTGGSGVNSTILGYRLAGGATGSANGTVPAAVDGGGRGGTDSPSYAGAAPTQYGGGGASVATAAYRTGYQGIVVIRYTIA